MKTFSCFILLLLLYGQTQSAVLIVNNNPGNVTSYTNIDQAMTAASSGDTIFINGSQTTYGAFYITKSITIIGPGTFAQRDQHQPAIIAGIAINGGLSNIRIMGLHIQGGISLVTIGSVSNVEVAYNYFNGIYDGLYNRCHLNLVQAFSISNMLVRSNIFHSSQALFECTSMSNCSNFFFENNLIYINGNGVPNNFTPTNATFTNNTFIDAFGVANDFSNIQNTAFNSNIFYNVDPANFNANCSFNNNLSFSSGAPFVALGGTNIDNADPLFVNVNVTTAFSITYNYNISSASPGHLMGADGTDIGLYGGGSNVTLTGEPFNMPVIREMHVLNPSVPQSGNVNVRVRSTLSRNE